MKKFYLVRCTVVVIFCFFSLLIDIETSPLSCKFISSEHRNSAHRTTAVSLVVSIASCQWPRNFTYFIHKLKADPKKVIALNTTNLINLPLQFNVTLNSSHFAKLDYLKIVNVTYSGITHVDENTFDELFRLEVINLSNNYLKNLEQRLFRKSKKLKELYLSGNRIVILPEFVFTSTKELSVLDLSYNYLETINSTELFRRTNQIRCLRLEGNRITTIYGNTFSKLNSLEFLNVSYNNLSFSAFANCNGLAALPENYYWFVDMALTTNGSVIDFRHNKITGIPLSGIQKACIHDRCKALTLLLDHNPLSCDCEGFDLIRYFHKGWPLNVVQVVRIKVEPTCSYTQNQQKSLFSQVDINRIYCTLQTCPNCPSECSCLLHKNSRTVLIKCVGKHLDTIPVNLPITRDDTSELWFGHNQIQNIDNTPYPYLVHVLSLSYNRIVELPLNFAKFSNLKVLELDNNKLKIITSDELKHIRTIKLNRLTLGNNPWNCSDCRILSMVRYLQNSLNVIVDGENVTCFGTGVPVAKLDPDFCKTPSPYYFIVLASMVSVVVLSVVFYLWNKMKPRVGLDLSKCDDSDRSHRMYDAFVSYAHQDEIYVANLVEKLEARKKPFKICLHSRDWMPGEFIVKQMADSVNHSRSSIIVLSSAYCRSKWCYSEFRIALTQMLFRRNHKVIAIWLSDEDPSKGGLDPDIRLYISTCTYLKYDDEQFMAKLESALM